LAFLAPSLELFNLSTGLWIETDSMKVPVIWLSCILVPNDQYLATGEFYDHVMKQYDQGMLAPGSYSLAIVSSELQCGAYMAIIQAGDSEKFAKLIIMH
jgi:hypothetical protein